MIVILSPHPDDAVWSIGAMVSYLRVTLQQNVTVVTVFSESTVAPTMRSLSGQPARVTIQRRNEDRNCSHILGFRLVDLRLPDCSMRGYKRHQYLGQILQDDILATVSRHHILETLKQLQPKLLFAPLAIGSHVDHLIVRHSVFESHYPTVFYEDLPYAMEVGGPGSVEAYVKVTFDDQLNSTLFHTNCEISRKLTYAQTYGSQAREKDLRAIAEYSWSLRRVPNVCERLWTRDRDAQLLSVTLAGAP